MCPLAQNGQVWSTELLAASRSDPGSCPSPGALRFQTPRERASSGLPHLGSSLNLAISWPRAFRQIILSPIF